MIRLGGVRGSALRLVAFLFLVGVAGAVVASRADASPTCGITWTGDGSTHSWFDAANWDLDRTPQTGDFVCIPSGSGTVLFDQSSSVYVDGVHAESPIDQSQGQLTIGGPDPSDVADFTLEGDGDLQDQTGGAVPFTVTHSFTFAGGTLDAGTYTVPSGSTFTVQGSDAKTLMATIDNAGTIVWNGTVQTAEFDHVNNTGVIDWQSGDAGHANLYNTGTLQADGAAPLDIDLNLQNDGTIDVPSGQDLTLKGGSQSESADTGSYMVDGVLRFQNSGNDSGYEIAGPVTGTGTVHTNTDAGVEFLGTLSVDTLVIEDGGMVCAHADLNTVVVESGSGTASGTVGGTVEHVKLESAGGVLGADDLHVTQSFSWTAGVLEGEMYVDPGAEADVTGSVALAGEFYNNGTLNLSTATIGLSDGFNEVYNQGLLDATGANSLWDWSNSGTVRVEPGASLEGPCDNAVHVGSLVRLSGGSWQVSGALQFGSATDPTTQLNRLDANVVLDGASAEVVGLDHLQSITSNGSLGLRGGAQLTTDTATTNQGNVSVDAGSEVQTGGSYVQTSGTTSLASSASLQSQAGVVDIQGGTLSGDGTVDASLSNEGTVEPALGGALQVSGSYTQADGGTLRIHADTPGTGELEVTGLAQLGGGLDVQDAPGYTPSPGDVLDVVTAGSRTGTFSSITDNLPPTLGFTGQYTGTTASVEAYAISPADLSAGLSVDAPVVAGGIATYHLSATDLGPADNFGLTAVLSGPTALHPASVPTGCQLAGGDVTCTASGLANGATTTWDVPLKIDESLSAGSTLEVDAAVSSTTPASPDPNGSNDATSVTSTVQRSADLGVTQSTDVDPVLTGDNVTYTVQVGTSGPGSAGNVVVDDSLTGNGQIQFIYPDRGYCQYNPDASYTCFLGTVSGPGGSGPNHDTITVVASGTQTGAMQNEAIVSSDDPDPTPGNNDSTLTTTVSGAVADLAMAGGAQSSSVQADSPLQYTFSMSNDGPDRALDPTVTIHFGQPVMVPLVSSSNGGCFTSSAQDVTCNIGVVPSGDDVTIHLTVTPIALGTLTSTASAAVGGTDTDPNHSNDAAESDVTVTGESGVQYVNVTDQGFDPATVTAKQGETVQWNFGDVDQQHAAMDPTAMALFNSGVRAGNVSYFRFAFVAAGKYSVHDPYGGYDGVVKVPMKVKPSAGAVTTGFKLTWSKAAPPAGFVFDVQVKRPGTTTWVYWKSDTTLMNANFIPDGGPGTYQFRSRLRRISNGAASGWSGAKKIDVS